MSPNYCQPWNTSRINWELAPPWVEIHLDWMLISTHPTADQNTDLNQEVQTKCDWKQVRKSTQCTQGQTYGRCGVEVCCIHISLNSPAHHLGFLVANFHFRICTPSIHPIPRPNNSENWAPLESSTRKESQWPHWKLCGGGTENASRRRLQLFKTGAWSQNSNFTTNHSLDFKH